MTGDAERQPAEADEARNRATTTNTIFEVIVVALTVLAAWAAYQAAVADDKSADLELQGQNLLSDAESVSAATDRFLLNQFRVFDEYVVADVDSLEEQYFLFELDDPLFEAAAFNRTADPDEYIEPFAESYFEQLYADSNLLFEQSFGTFQESATEGERALGYQGVVLTFAIGLSFAAWGGLADEVKRRSTRRLFLMLAIAATVIGVLQLVAV